jgi:hypothetical protein
VNLVMEVRSLRGACRTEQSVPGKIRASSLSATTGRSMSYATQVGILRERSLACMAATWKCMHARSDGLNEC